MKKAVLLYNPHSGDGKLIFELDKIIGMYQEKGYFLHLVRLSERINLHEIMKDFGDIDHYIVAGGDGTVDIVLNEMIAMDKNIPFGIIPSGTANDFAKYLGMPINNIEECVNQILNLQPQKVDLPVINDKYFINVFSLGYFTDISQKTDPELKNKIGKMAYYLKSMELLRDLNKSHVKVTSEELNFEGDIYLIMVLNGISAGNLIITNESKANDGLLDVLIVKAASIPELVPPAIKIMQGNLTEDNSGKVIYFKTKELKIEGDGEIPTDVDGEKTDSLPVTLKCLEGKLTILGIKTEM